MTTTQAPSPLLESIGLPRFDAIRPEHVEPAVRSLLEALGATVARLQDDPAAPTWDNFVQPIEDDGERLGDDLVCPRSGRAYREVDGRLEEMGTEVPQHG